VLSVDIEEELNAEHIVEPDSDMQLCAVATGAAARIESRVVFVLIPIDRRFRLLEPTPFLDVFLAIVRGRSDLDIFIRPAIPSS
jgi:hypothetical protein